MNKARVAIVTTSRADYGLLKPLWKAFQGNSVFELMMIATGGHLQETQGYSVKFIEKDGITPLINVDLQQNGDSESSVCEAMAHGLLGFSECFTKNDFDLLIVLGDRYELLPACNAALIHKIPMAHIHGGEATYGLIDEAIRHSVTKMSALHFVAHESYRNRVIQMGEHPSKVFNVGAIGLDNFNQVKPWSKKKLEMETNLNFTQPVLLLTFHPVTLDAYDSATEQANQLLSALEQLPYAVLATLPNSDTGSLQILKRLKQAMHDYPGKFEVVSTLGVQGYSAAMKYSAAMVGNSSSGIIEAASFKLPVVNIGDRQAGRIQPINIIQTECEVDPIKQAINKALSSEFNQSLQEMKNPYGDGGTAQKIVEQLAKVDFKDKAALLKKQFYDLEQT